MFCFYWVLIIANTLIKCLSHKSNSAAIRLSADVFFCSSGQRSADDHRLNADPMSEKIRRPIIGRRSNWICDWGINRRERAKHHSLRCEVNDGLTSETIGQLQTSMGSFSRSISEGDHNYIVPAELKDPLFHSKWQRGPFNYTMNTYLISVRPLVLIFLF